MLIQKLSSTELQVEIDLEHGGRFSSIKFQGHEFVIPNNQRVLHWGWYPMVPWAGRINKGEYLGHNSEIKLPTDLMPPHAIHGFGHSQVWQDDGAGRSSCRFANYFDGASATQDIRVVDNQIFYNLQYIPGTCELPAWLGLHTWFPWFIDGKPKATISFEADYMLEQSSDGIPTGNLIPASDGPWDDTFVDLVHAPKIIWPGVASLEISSPASWWTCYTKDPSTFCVEPLNAPPDAVRINRLVGNTHNLDVIFTFNQES